MHGGPTRSAAVAFRRGAMQPLRVSDSPSSLVSWDGTAATRSARRPVGPCGGGTAAVPARPAAATSLPRFKAREGDPAPPAFGPK